MDQVNFYPLGKIMTIPTFSLVGTFVFTFFEVICLAIDGRVVDLSLIISEVKWPCGKTAA